MKEIISVQNSMVKKEDHHIINEGVNMFNNTIGQISLVLHLNALPDEIDFKAAMEEIKINNSTPGAKKYTREQADNIFRNTPTYKTDNDKKGSD